MRTVTGLFVVCIILVKSPDFELDLLAFVFFIA
jgi:hypothetical protein